MTLKRLSQSSFVRFLIVGGVTAGIYAVLASLATTHLPLPKALSSTLTWVIFIPVTFALHRRISFSVRKAHRHGLLLYAATQGLSLLIVAAISQLFAQGSFRHDLIVHLFGSAAAAVSSYAINRRFVFPAASAD